MDSVTELKRKLRDRYTAARKAVDPADAERKSGRIAANIRSLPRLRGSTLILAYSKIGSEADAAPLIDLFLASGVGVALPYCRGGGELGIGQIFNPRGDLVKGAYGVMEPADRLKDNISPDRLSAVVCPGVAFDKTGTRLGRGGGHYDRFLQKLAGKIFIVGCAFDCQISPEPLPRESRDVQMDAVITETSAFQAERRPAINPSDGGAEPC